MKAFVTRNAKPAFLSVSGEKGRKMREREEDREEGRSVGTFSSLGPPRPTVLVPEYWFSVTKPWAAKRDW
jgi:hypothetical protein